MWLATFGRSFINSKDVIRHVKYHLHEGFEMSCPYLDCSKSYKVVSSFTSHVSTQHSCLNSDLNDVHSVAHETSEDTAASNDCIISSCDVNSDSNDNTSVNFREVLKHLCLFFMSLQYQHFVPASTSNQIASEINSLLFFLQNRLKESITDILKTEQVSEDAMTKIQHLIDEINCTGQLKTEFFRQLTYKKFFNVVTPVSYYFSERSDHLKSEFQYVSIIEPLVNLFSLDYVKEQFLNSKNYSGDSVLTIIIVLYISVTIFLIQMKKC